MFPVSGDKMCFFLYNGDDAVTFLDKVRPASPHFIHRIVRIIEINENNSFIVM